MTRLYSLFGRVARLTPGLSTRPTAAVAMTRVSCGYLTNDRRGTVVTTGRSLQQAPFSMTAGLYHGKSKRDKGSLSVTFITPEGEEISVPARDGESLLDIAHDNDVDLEGACEASLACSTCHVILEPDVFDRLEEPSDEENDMLDLAFGLTETSRLGCQVIMSKDLDGIRVRLPSATRNMAVDGYKPKPH
ncbi:2Fe-2S ferredoxin-type domain-containing protein [Syncephalis fuscata]|nr:2Fe-2S ferredoxin-type domain-containing protein [Syncephalis fuscata]